MKLFAKKPCRFNGRDFIIGEEIPAEYILEPKVQERRGVIAIISDGNAIPSEELKQYTAQVGIVKFEVPIHTEDGDIVVLITNDELKVFTDIRQIGVSSTEDKQKISEMIQNIESEDLLILLDALDGRKHVKEEAMARAEALQKPGNTPDENTSDGDAPKGDAPGGDE